MSISGALSNALSGLTASSRNAQVVSNNLANALTPGYAARALTVSSQAEGRGGGVLITGITRDVDHGLIGERRLADSDLARVGVMAGFLDSVERAMGTPDQPQSLSGRVARFEADLITAASKPEEETRLRAAVLSAADLADHLNTLSQTAQTLRTDAETRISQDVSDANTYLGQLQGLNARIVDARNAGHPSASFEDQRRIVLDRLGEIVPLRVAHRGNGSVAVYTTGGATLLDGRPAELSFEPANLVTAHMTLENGLLSGLSINGQAVAPSGKGSPLDGGRLAAHFDLRDRLGTGMQRQLDAVARDLVERFQATGLDPTRMAGDPGLFTDGGLAFDPANETGLAGRITLHDALRPETGGAHWRLRDGLGAVMPGAPGNAALLTDLGASLARPGALASGDLGQSERGVAGHIGAMVSHFAQMRLAADQEVSFAIARQNGLLDLELAMGVDSDAELQNLLLVEQAYNANARMIQAVEEMMDALLRI